MDLNTIRRMAGVEEVYISESKPGLVDDVRPSPEGLKAIEATIDALEKDAANATDRGQKAMYMQDAADYEKVLQHAENGDQKLARTAFAEMDTAARDELFDVVKDTRLRQKLANYLGLDLNENVNEATDTNKDRFDNLGNKFGSKNWSYANKKGNTDGKAYDKDGKVVDPKKVNEDCGDQHSMGVSMGAEEEEQNKWTLGEFDNEQVTLTHNGEEIKIPVGDWDALVQTYVDTQDSRAGEEEEALADDEQYDADGNVDPNGAHDAGDSYDAERAANRARPEDEESMDVVMRFEGTEGLSPEAKKLTQDGPYMINLIHDMLEGEGKELTADNRAAKLKWLSTDAGIEHMNNVAGAVKEGAENATVWDKAMDDKDESPESPHEDDAKIKIPSNVTSKLKKEIAELQAAAKKTKVMDSMRAEFYDDCADALQVILEQLDGTIDGLKRAQIHMLKLMSPIVQRIPDVVYDFITRGGVPRSLKDIVKKVKKKKAEPKKDDKKK